MNRQLAHVCLGLALIVGLGACTKTPPLAYHTVELPGFTVQAPTQLVYQADLVTTYRSGKVEWKDRRRQILVSWRRGVPMTADDVPVIVKAIGGIAPPSAGQFVADSGVITASGLQGFQVTLKNAGYRIQFFEAACGKRVITVAVAAHAAEMPSLWAKLTTAITCAPLADEEAKLETTAPITPAEPELLAGWELMPDDSSYIIANNDRVIVAHQVAKVDGLTSTLVQSTLELVVRQIGGTWAPGQVETKNGPFGRRDLMFGVLIVDETEFDTVVSVFRCDSQSAAMMLLVMGEKTGTPAAELAELSTKIRCATPGDPPLRLAPAEPLHGIPAEK